MKARVVALVALLCLPCICTGRNLIEGISVQKNKLKITVNEWFKQEYLTDDFFVKYEPDIDLEQFDYSILTLPFIMNVITIIWISGDTYYVDEMDKELYESLQRVKKVFKVMYPKTLWHGQLKPRKLVLHSPGFKEDASKTALLFSGGVDSVASALNHKDKNQLLITAWGHWDLPLGNHSLWKTRAQKIKAFAQSFSNESTILRSNYTSILDYAYLSELSPEIPKWRLGAVEGLGWAGLTTPILLSKGYSTLRIASSHTWAYPYPSAASPFIDNNLRLCGLRVLHDQFDMTRLEKIKFICDTYKSLQMKPPFLKVCSFEKAKDANCEECRKCLTTIACFAALGEDPTPYGLYYDEYTAKGIQKLFSQKELNYYTILQGKELQATIRTRRKNNQWVDHRFRKFLNLSFDHKKPFDTKHQKKLNWQQMISLLPEDHGLAIPESLIPKEHHA